MANGVPSIIGDYAKARRMVRSANSSLQLMSQVLHAPIPSEYLGDMHGAIIELLTQELKIYSSELQGVPVAFNEKTAKLLGNDGAMVSAQPYIHCNISADFVVFKPKVGDLLNAVVTKDASDVFGCLVHGCFYAAIMKKDEDPKRILRFKEDSKIRLIVTKLAEDGSGILEIIGKLAPVARKRSGNDSGIDSNPPTTPPPAIKSARRADIENVNPLNLDESLNDSILGSSHVESVSNVIKKKHKEKKEKKQITKEKEIANEDRQTTEVHSNGASVENLDQGHGIAHLDIHVLEKSNMADMEDNSMDSKKKHKKKKKKKDKTQKQEDDKDYQTVDPTTDLNDNILAGYDISQNGAEIKTEIQDTQALVPNNIGADSSLASGNDTTCLSEEVSSDGKRKKKKSKKEKKREKKERKKEKRLRKKALKQEAGEQLDVGGIKIDVLSGSNEENPVESDKQTEILDNVSQSTSHIEETESKQMTLIDTVNETTSTPGAETPKKKRKRKLGPDTSYLSSPPSPKRMSDHSLLQEEPPAVFDSPQTANNSAADITKHQQQALFHLQQLGINIPLSALSAANVSSGGISSFFSSPTLDTSIQNDSPSTSKKKKSKKSKNSKDTPDTESLKWKMCSPTKDTLPMPTVTDAPMSLTSHAKTEKISNEENTTFSGETSFSKHKKSKKKKEKKSKKGKVKE